MIGAKYVKLHHKLQKQFSTVVQIFIYLVGFSDFLTFVFINMHEYATFTNFINFSLTMNDRKMSKL